jgi:hypothetical protein
MSDTPRPDHRGSQASASIDAFCEGLRVGLHKVSEALSPPESASRHFRTARIEVLRGMRELIDHRIDRLTKTREAGTKVVVE